MTRFNSTKYLESDAFPFHTAIAIVDAQRPVPPHSHEFVEMAYIAGGSGRHVYRGQDYNIAEGDVFIIEPDEEHAYWVADGDSLIVYNVLFQSSLLAHEITAMSAVTPFVDFYYVEPFLRGTVHFRSHLRLQPLEQLEMKAMLDRLRMEFREKRLGYQILTKTKLLEMFVFLSRCYATSEQSPVSSLANDEKAMMYVRQFIRHHYAKPLSLQQMSQLCGMSPSAFSAKFKLYTGRTFIEFRNDIRIRHAAELLLQSHDKVIVVAQAIGFDDVSFFNKLFKSTFGCSPSIYRQHQRGTQT